MPRYRETQHAKIKEPRLNTANLWISLRWLEFKLNNLYLKSCFSLTLVGGMGEMKITSEFRMKRQEVCLSDDLDFDSNIVKHAKHGIFVGVM